MAMKYNICRTHKILKNEPLKLVNNLFDSSHQQRHQLTKGEYTSFPKLYCSFPVLKWFPSAVCSMVNSAECKDLASLYLENLKASNVKDSNEGCTLSLGLIQCLIDTHNQPPEHTFISGFSQGFNGKISLNRKKHKIRFYIIIQRKA